MQIIGSPAKLSRTDCSFVICDGDLELTYYTMTSVIIANGDIVCRSYIDHSKLYAAGKIKSRKESRNTGELHEFGKGMPVRFLGLGEDLGLRVTGKLVLEDDWRGLRKGDTITKIDGAAVDSIPSLRKQLRRGIVRWSATVEARRGNESISRVVWLDLSSIPVAPPPREVKK